jgi:hypothetical protein
MNSSFFSSLLKQQCCIVIHRPFGLFPWHKGPNKKIKRNNKGRPKALENKVITVSPFTPNIKNSSEKLMQIHKLFHTINRYTQTEKHNFASTRKII